MVLGRDFLKKRKVIVDHGRDALTIEGVTVLVNLTEAGDLEAPEDQDSFGLVKKVSFQDENVIDLVIPDGALVLLKYNNTVY